jgi:hypothetical protein
MSIVFLTVVLVVMLSAETLGVLLEENLNLDFCVLLCQLDVLPVIIKNNLIKYAIIIASWSNKQYIYIYIYIYKYTSEN